MIEHYQQGIQRRIFLISEFLRRVTFASPDKAGQLKEAKKSKE